MKLHYSLLILAITNTVLQCSDNNNEPKKLTIVEVFSNLASKAKHTKSEKAQYNATKKELRNILSQDFAASSHAQIENALANDMHKTPENSPKKKELPKIQEIKKQHFSAENKENMHPKNVRFGLVKVIDYGRAKGTGTTPQSLQLDKIYNEDTYYYASAKDELVARNLLKIKTNNNNTK